jgi:hypothetical protein
MEGSEEGPTKLEMVGPLASTFELAMIWMK